ncbi:MAG: sigma-70 family RNA polymerase sigma factor [Opitutaceae bacterium]|jgi:RNA polymerase sigma-70 factor (ECF subfamily)
MSPVEELHWFNAEVKPCEPALRAYLQKRFPLLSDHDDLVQEAYTRLLCARRAGRLTCAKAFLFTVTRNLAIDMFRRQRRTAIHEPISELAEMPALEQPSDTVDSLDHQYRLEVLIEAVASLPERCREVMMLRHLDGLSYKEIAEQLGISPNTVKVHMVKGVRDCTVFFRKHGLLENTMAAKPVTLAEDSNR